MNQIGTKETRMRTLILTTLLTLVTWGAVRAEGTLQVAVFDVDATPRLARRWPMIESNELTR